MLPPFARRAPSPLVPRPAVLPCPAEMPRPTGFLCFLLPGAGCRSCNFIASILVKTYGVFCNRTRNTPSGLHLFHLPQMPDLRQHAAQLRRVGLFHGLVQATEAKRGHGGLVLLGVPQWAAHQGEAQPLRICVFFSHASFAGPRTGSRPLHLCRGAPLPSPGFSAG